MPVLPEVGSTITLRPGTRRPSASAASIIARPMRSFTDPAGLHRLELAEDHRPRPLRDPPEAHQRGAPDQVRDGVGDRHRREPTRGPGRGAPPPPGEGGEIDLGAGPEWEMTSAAASDAEAARSRRAARPWVRP